MRKKYTCLKCKKDFDKKKDVRIATVGYICKACLGEPQTEKKKKKPAKSEWKKLRDKLDAIFSKFIRLRDSDENGIIKCCTCDSRKSWKKVDCGHFIPRQYLSTRWEESNCHAQTKDCNGFHGGRMDLHEKHIIKLHGQSEVDRLNLKMKHEKASPVKIYEFELQEMIEIYTKKANFEASKRGIEL